MKSLIACLHALRHAYPQAVLDAIQPIIEASIRDNRFDPKGDQPLLDYVTRVADFYLEEHAFVDSLRLEREKGVWESFYTELRQKVSSHLKYQRQVDLLRDHPQSITDITTAVSLVVLKKYPPFDLPFSSWVNGVIYNCTREQIRITFGKESDHQPIEAEHSSAAISPSIEAQLIKVEKQADIDNLVALLKAEIERLPRSQKLVIEGLFFESKKPAALATELNIEVNAVYQAKFKALKKLEKRMQTHIQG